MMLKGLRGVGELYELIEEILHLPSSHSLQTCQVEEQLDCSRRLLDVTGSARDSLIAMREHVQDIQSAIRRKGNTCVNSRKKARKMVKDCLKSLAQIGGNHIVNDTDQMLKVLIEAREITISLLRSVLSLLSMPKTKSSLWFIVSIAISKRKVACKGASDEESVDMCLQASYDCILRKDADSIRIQMAHNDLQALHSRIEGLESGIEFLFRQSLRNRVTLLNILSL